MANLGDIILGNGRGICMFGDTILLYKKHDDPEEEQGSQEGGGGGSPGGHDGPVPENEMRTVVVWNTYKGITADGDVISYSQELKVDTYSNSPSNLVPVRAIHYYESDESSWEVVSSSGTITSPYGVKVAGVSFHYDETDQEDKSASEKEREALQRSSTEYSTLNAKHVFDESELKDKDAKYIYWDGNKKNLCPTVVVSVFDELSDVKQQSSGTDLYPCPEYLQKTCLVDADDDYSMYFGVWGYDGSLKDRNADYARTLYIYKIKYFNLSE